MKYIREYLTFLCAALVLHNSAIACTTESVRFQSNNPGCPSLPFPVGACAEECSSDRDCRVDEKCCSNGCGHQCTNVFNKCAEVKCDICPYGILSRPSLGKCCPTCKSRYRYDRIDTTGCWPGEIFTAQDGCNTCFCSTGGPICTRMYCESTQRNYEYISSHNQ